jgi:hypothetical protein
MLQTVEELVILSRRVGILQGGYFLQRLFQITHNSYRLSAEAYVLLR